MLNVMTQSMESRNNIFWIHMNLYGPTRLPVAIVVTTSALGCPKLKERLLMILLEHSA